MQIKKSFFTCASLVAAASFMALPARDASAQETLAPIPLEKLPRFTVELIVFTYDDTDSGSSEIFVPDPPPLDPYLPEDSRQGADPVPVFSDVPPAEGNGPADGAQRDEPSDESMAEPASDGKPASAEPANEIAGFDGNLADLPLRTRIELHLLEPEQYTMDEIYERLVNLDAYEPIMRTAWTQTTPAEDLSPAIRLRALGDPPRGLQGTVKLYQGRFVHLGLDLALNAETYDGGGADAEPRDAREAATDKAIGYYGDRSYGDRTYGDPGSAAANTPWPRPVRYRISEIRIMKDGTIRYYDHPRFGVIAKLTEVPEPEEDSGSRATSALTGAD